MNLHADGIALAHIVRIPNEKPRLEACTFIPCADPTDNDMVQQSISGTVETLCLEGMTCSYILSPGDYTLSLLEAPNVPKEELTAAAKWQVKDLIDYSPEDAAIEVFQLPGYGPGGQRKMMFVVTAHIDHLRHHVQMLNRSNLQTNIIDIPDLALRNIAALVEPASVDSSALLYLQPRGSLLVISKSGELVLSRSIELDLTPLLAPSAEGDSSVTANDTVLDSVASELTRTFDYYRTQVGQTPPEKLLLASSSHQTSGIATQLNEKIPAQIETMNLATAIDYGTSVDNATCMRCLIAVGGALRLEEKENATD